MELYRRKKTVIDLNIAPLIDIVFLLLIFFMLGSKFIADQGIKIKLPAAESAAAQNDKNLSIIISREGTISINDRVVKPGSLEQELARHLDGMHEKNIIIRADKDIPLNLAVQVMDASKKAGAEGVTIATGRKDREQ